ncbi:MAG: hypothetical protein ACP5EK_01535 [Thermoplasmatota archaeon]
MVVTVPESILARTTKCHRDFACLEEEDGRTCPVERYLGDGLLFVEPADDIYCSYRTSFGHSYICGCPVRRELYLSYQR